MTVAWPKMVSHWSSVILCLVVLTIIGLCGRQSDSGDDIKPLISVLFGFAASCLLLSFIWIIQKRSLNETTQLQAFGIQEEPSMYPRGRLGSDNSSNDSSDIQTLSAAIDNPPNYEDALVYSKPLNRSSANGLDKANSYYSNLAPDRQRKISAPCRCDTGEFNLCAKHNTMPILEQPAQGSRSDYIISFSDPTSGTSLGDISNKNASSGMARLAMTIVRGFAAIDHPNLYQQSSRQRRISSNTARQLEQYTSGKQDFAQLDVNQLACGSPPKYHELSLESFTRDEDARSRSHE